MKLLLVFCVFFSLVLCSYADCYTGFACSITDLEQKQAKKYKEFNENLNKYFIKETNADFFFVKKFPQIAYNDLFMFNTIL